MQVGELLSRLEAVKKTANGWDARCPVPGHEDVRPSLSVAIGDNGGIVLHCHKGCSPQDVVSALDLTLWDLMRSDNGCDGDGRPETVATYDYRDENGELLFQVCRTHPRGFFQRRPADGGGWVNSTKGVRRVPYRLPDLLAADPSEPVFVPEGEKDVDRLWSLDLVATCNSGGAGKWRSEYGQVLTDRTIVILPDNDQPGRQHAETIARSLRSKAASVKILELPNLPPKDDVSDWLDAGGTAEELRRLAEEAPEWEPEAKPPQVVTSDAPHLTDVGNAQRLIGRHGRNLRYCHPWSKWLYWDGRRWALDQVGAVERLAKDTARSILTEAAEEEDGKQRKAIVGFAFQSESASRIAAMMRLAQSEEGIPTLPNELDVDPWLLNCPNGTLDLRTGELRKHRREEFITKLCPVRYDPAATAPRWYAFLGRIFDSNERLIQYTKRLAGYCLTGDVSEQILVIFYGTGANGKTTYLETLLALQGEDYSIKAPQDLLMAKRGDSHPTERADLFGKRLVTCIETADNRRLAESLVKELTGGDTIRARRMREDFWQFGATHKIILATNHKPVIRGTDQAIWRRIRLVPFQVAIPDKEQDKGFPGKLRDELPGILAWCVQGCLDWQRDGLDCPDEVKAATADYREEQDILGAFLEECTVQVVGATVRASSLYEVYRKHCERNGENPLGRRNFGTTMTERGFKRFTANGVWYKGLDLKGWDDD